MSMEVVAYNQEEIISIRVKPEALLKIPYFEAMRSFQGGLDDTIRLNLDGFDPNLLKGVLSEDLGDKLRAYVLLDYLCISPIEVLRDYVDCEGLSTDIRLFISMVCDLERPQYFQEVLWNSEFHLDHVYDQICAWYGGAYPHPAIQGLFEYYMDKLYTEVFFMETDDLISKDSIMIYRVEHIWELLAEEPNSGHPVYLERMREVPCQWRDLPGVYEWLDYLTNGFISPEFLENNPGITLSGGLMSALLSMGDEDLLKYVEESSPDLDIYILSETAKTRREAVVQLIREICQLHKVFVAYNKNIITIQIKGALVPIQIILSDYTSVWDLFSTFDMVHLQVALNGVEGWVATTACILAHRDRITRFHSIYFVKPYRILKALQRGFSIEPNDEIRYYCELLGKELFIDIGINYSTRGFNNHHFKRRRFLRFLGKRFNGCWPEDLEPLIDAGTITINANFRSPLFHMNYDGDIVHFRGRYDYIPIIEEGRFIGSKDHYFTFGNVQVELQNSSFKCSINKIRNRFMWDMLSAYLERLREAYGCQQYYLGVADSETAFVIQDRHTVMDINTTYVHRLSVYVIIAVKRDDNMLYIHLATRED